MSNRTEAGLKEWLVKRNYNITASKMACIVKEYSNHPYWSNINCYGDAYSVYCESLMSPDELVRRSKETEAYYTRFGNFAEPFIYEEFLKALELESSIKESDIVYNKFYSIPDLKIACTPDYIIQNIPSYTLSTFNRNKLSKMSNLRNFEFVTSEDFNPQGNSFLIECKAKGWNQVQKEYKRNSKGELVPPDSILLQLETQMLVTGISWGVITTMIFTDQGLKFHYYFTEANKETQNIMVDSVKKYFSDIKKGVIPIPKAEWDKSLDYISLGIKIEDTLDLTAALQGTQLEEFIMLLKEYLKIQDSLTEIENKLDGIKEEFDYHKYIKEEKILKSNIDKYIQLVANSKEDIKTVVRDNKGNSYTVEITREADWVNQKTKVLSIGDIIKKGTRNIVVKQFSS